MYNWPKQTASKNTLLTMWWVISFSKLTYSIGSPRVYGVFGLFEYKCINKQQAKYPYINMLGEILIKAIKLNRNTKSLWSFCLFKQTTSKYTLLTIWREKIPSKLSYSIEKPNLYGSLTFLCSICLNKQQAKYSCNNVVGDIPFKAVILNYQTSTEFLAF